MKQKLIQTLGVCVLLCFTITAMAQTRTVTGTVLDDKDAALVGAVVKEKGTKNGAITGDGGTFTITVTTENPVLVITYFGMEEQEVTLGESNTITIKMVASTEQMGRVVVTASTQAKSTRTLGYSVTSVSDVQLTEGGDRSVLNSMQGKVAGVTINQASSDPGASTRVIIRGIQSLTQGNQPLIVVDGVPLINNSVNTNDLDPNSTIYNTLSAPFDFGNGLNAINPEDIESIDILKGASATALYGSRAANGVIMITTKKGSGVGSGIGILYSGNVTYNSVLRMPTFQNTYGQGWDGNHWLDENGSWGPEFDGRDRVFGRVIDNSQLLKPYEALENNVRDFFERGVAVKNHVALQGATATGNFYASFSNINQNGIYPGDVDVYKRTTISLRAMQDFGLVRINGSMNIADISNNFVPTGQGQQGVYNNLMQVPRDMSVVDMADYNARFYNIEDFFTQYGVTNPYFILNENKNGYEGKKFFGGLETFIDLPDNLGFTYRFGYDIESHFIHTHRAILLPKGVNAGSIDDPGFVSEQTLQRYQLNHDFLLTYNKELNSFLNFDVLGGFNINSRGTNSLITAVNGLDIPGFYNVSNSPSTPLVQESESLRRLMGLFGVATLAYKNYLFLNVSARNDWSSTLPEENRSFFYPAANVSYVLTDAVPGLGKYLDYARLRVGYGWSGNDAPVYVTSSVYTQASNNMPFRDFTYPLASGVNAFTAGNRIKNPDLQPEITKELELGAELRFWDNRILLDFTYYDRTTDGQILIVPVSPGSGYSNYYANPAVISNKGIEALASVRVLRNEKGLNWIIGGNFTRNRNNVDKLDESVEEFAIGGLSTTSIVAVAGQPIGIFKGNVPKTDPNGNLVVDANGVPVAATEKGIYGNIQQKYILGINNYFSWKGFSLSFTFDIRKGGMMFSRTADINYFTGNGIHTTYNDRKPFVVPNSVVEIDNGDGTYSYEENTTAIDPAHMDDYFRADAWDRWHVIDKSFTKLREVNFTYTVPKALLERMPFTGLRVSLIGRNLLLWTPVENQFIDPETTSFGNGLEAEFGEFSANPTTRSYGFALVFTL